MREMFPMTEEERIGLLRKNLQSDVDKRLAKRDTAAVALDEAQEAEDMARGLLAAFDHLVRERASQRTGSAMEAAVELKRNAEKDGIGLSFAVNGGEPIVVTEAPAVDPITGEVDDSSCDTCGRDWSCNLRQREGSGHTGCGGDSWKARTPEVFVIYPGDDEPHVTKIGEHTRYGELVADYFTAAGLTGKHDAKDWTVVAEDELTTTGGGYRSLRDVIEAGDYGKRLLVAAADQGSVTGAPAEKVTP